MKHFFFFLSLVFSLIPDSAFAYWQRGGNRVCYSPSYMSALFSKPKEQEGGGLRSEIRALEREIRQHQRDMDEWEASLSGSLDTNKLGDGVNPNVVAGAIRGYIEGAQNGWNCGSGGASSAHPVRTPSFNPLFQSTLETKFWQNLFLWEDLAPISPARFIGDPSLFFELLLPESAADEAELGDSASGDGMASDNQLDTNRTQGCAQANDGLFDSHTCKPGILDAACIADNCCPKDHLWKPKDGVWECVENCGENWVIEEYKGIGKKCVCEDPNTLEGGECAKKGEKCVAQGGVCKSGTEDCLLGGPDCCSKEEGRQNPVWKVSSGSGMSVVWDCMNNESDEEKCEGDWKGDLDNQGNKMKCCPSDGWERHPGGPCCLTSQMLHNDKCVSAKVYCEQHKNGECKPDANNCLSEENYDETLCCFPSAGGGQKKWVDGECSIVASEEGDVDEDGTCIEVGNSCVGSDTECCEGSRCLGNNSNKICCGSDEFLKDDQCADSCGDQFNDVDGVCHEKTAQQKCEEQEGKSWDEDTCCDTSTFQANSNSCQTTNNCPDWKNHPAFQPNGKVTAAFCDDYASDARVCKRSLQKMKRLANKIARAQENLAEKEDERWEQRYGDKAEEEETEAGGLCWDCLKRSLDASRPTAGQQIGNALSMLTGAGLSVVGYNMGRRAQYDANMQRIDRGGHAARNDYYSFAGAKAGFPFIHRGIYGITKVGTPSGGWSCSPSVNSYSYY